MYYYFSTAIVVLELFYEGNVVHVAKGSSLSLKGNEYTRESFWEV